MSNSSGIIQEDPVPGWHLRSSSIKRRSGAAGRSIALPTSAGKTRIAELAALMTLSAGKRVLIVTPLRALSAQTERSFRRTFGPLGFSVSSLYGASGVSATDEDALRSKNIVIATPEKLDFALRNDPSIIADVGLIVLDEGHMIGPTEREIRYETLVQRLLRREDAASRRIVCLSAILPEGDQLDDLTAWIRNDAPGGPVTFRWRPMRQRFGHLIWRSATRNKPAGAQLYFDSRTEVPFLARFIEEIPSASSSETTLAARSERPVNLCGVEVRGTRQARLRGPSALLTGRIFDAYGNRMSHRSGAARRPPLHRGFLLALSRIEVLDGVRHSPRSSEPRLKEKPRCRHGGAKYKIDAALNARFGKT